MKKLNYILIGTLTLVCTVSFAASKPLLAKNNDLQQVRTINQDIYITRTGHKFHRAGCRYISHSAIKISQEDAEKNYSPCKVCRP